MANKLAPYKDERILGVIKAWWDDVDGRCNPMARQPQTVMSLYRAFLEATGTKPWDDGFVDRDQFAKCLVALRIANTGPYWQHLPEWIPKTYELTKAKAE